MEEWRSCQFRDLQAGDELVLRGDDLEAGAIVLKVHPFELVVHWLDLADHDVVQMRILGSHAGLDRDSPFGPRFTPGEMLPGTFVMLVPGTSDNPALEELRYLKVTRDGLVIYETGNPELAEQTAP
jgi:hypothetical protein